MKNETREIPSKGEPYSSRKDTFGRKVAGVTPGQVHERMWQQIVWGGRENCLYKMVYHLGKEFIFIESL